MARIKHTKTELKTQREALRRYERFLPMLQMKKQQLQMEIQGVDAKVDANREAERKVRADIERWVRLLSEPVGIESMVEPADIRTSEGNIAGVVIPILDAVSIRRTETDLYATPPWVDDAAGAIEQLTRLRVEREILVEQRRLISEELRTTSQRVNLFEKVKIPECAENIRVIKIFLGDEQTAGVARAKTAKSRTLDIETLGWAHGSQELHASEEPS